MGVFDGLMRLIGSRPDSGKDLERLAEAWGLGDTQDETDHAGPMPEDPDEATAYDRVQWIRRLKRTLADLPASEGDWPDLQADARALGFDPDWIDRQQREEFTILARQIVSDGVFDGQERRKLDLARDLIGIPTAEAEAALQAVVDEAEAFFGKPVERP